MAAHVFRIVSTITCIHGGTVPFFVRTKMSFISQFRTQIRSYIYNPVYKGPFEYKKRHTKLYKFPNFNKTPETLERCYEEMNEVRAQQIPQDQVSPFHLVQRYKPFGGTVWTEKVILRRLGLHQKERNVPVIIPNTPHYNKMLWEVKHLIRIKPLLFPDGIPKESDLGCIKLDIETGEMRINPAYRIPQELLDKSAGPEMFKGRYMREYLKWASGMVGRSLPNLEVDDKDGQRIEDYDRKMKNYYNHQHSFYTSNKKK